MIWALLEMKFTAGKAF